MIGLGVDVILDILLGINCWSICANASEVRENTAGASISSGTPHSLGPLNCMQHIRPIDEKLTEKWVKITGII